MNKFSLTSKSLHYTLLGIIGLLIVGLVGGTYAANQILSKQAEALLDARTQSQAVNQQSEQLARTKADIEKYKALSDIAKGVVPQDKNQANTVRELYRMATENQIPLASITFPVSTLGGPAVAAAKPAGGSSTPAPKAALSQLTPAPGLNGVFTMPITITSDTEKPVPYQNFINFLSALEKNRRTALVSTITLQPNSTNAGVISFSLNVDEYIKP